MNHVVYIVQVPGCAGHYVRYDPHSPRSGSVVTCPLYATPFHTHQEALGHIGYGDFFTNERGVPTKDRMVVTRGAHVWRLTLEAAKSDQWPAREGTWTLEDLGDGS